MNNHLKILILSILVLLILFAIYMLMNVSNSKQTVKIEPIYIKPIKILPHEVIVKKSVEKKHISILPIDILSKLKRASEQSTKPANILASLKKEAEKQTIKKTITKKVLVKKVLIKTKPIRKKIVINKKLKPKVRSNVQVRVRVKKNQKRIKPITTFITSKKELSPQNTQESQKIRKLSREKEVALYNETYADTLEIVNVSDSFEIKEENILADSDYFEPIQSSKTIENNAPLEFVEKLGVLMISDEYESNFIIPKKINFIKEGIVDISNASLETNEMKNLNFVDTLGIVESSEYFETIDGDEHLN